jgi:hypothetical protein
MSIETISIDTFTREFVESLEPKVKKVDSDGDIDLFCYTTCDDSDPEYIKACRGLVFHKDTLIMKAFSYTPDYTAKDFEYLNGLYPDTSPFLIYDSY